MAKQKLVARVRFDDGSKKGPSGKATDYEIGEEYKGENTAQLKKDGMICSESELVASKEVIDEKDRAIRALEDKLAKALSENVELQKELDELKTATNSKGNKKAE